MMSMQVAENELLRAALQYAAWGLRVFPVHTPICGGKSCSCSKGAECSNIGKHPRTKNGLTDATVDPSQIETWWVQWPTANVGACTGDRYFVVDFDPRHGGTSAGLDLPETRRANTGGGGEHWWFRKTVAIRNGANVLRPGVDIRGDGGYVLMPPSLHESGRRYDWDAGMADQAAEAPEWLIKACTQKQRATAAVEGEPAIADVFLEGGRNAGLASLGGAMRRKGFTPAAIEAALLEENRRRCRPALDEREVTRIALSVGRYPANDPVDPKDPFSWQGTSELLLSELGEFPWLVAAMQLGPGRPCGLWGYGGTGKSWIAMGLALTIASGVDFLGRFAVRRGRVRHLSHEMGLRTLKERYRRLASGMMLPPEDIYGQLEVSAYPKVYLNSKDAEALYRDALDGVALCVIDSLRRALPGEDENDSIISNYLDLLGRVSNDTGCSFLVLHHSGKAVIGADEKADKRGAGRGSSAIFDGSSCIWLVEGTGNSPRQCTHIRQHEDAEIVLEPFWIDMPVCSVGDNPLYKSTRLPVKIQILDADEVEKLQRRAIVKGNLEAFDKTARLILETLIEKGPLSQNKLLRSVGDSKRIRGIIKELISEDRIATCSAGLKATETSGEHPFDWDPQADEGRYG